MTSKSIRKALERALLHGGDMRQGLYELELEERVGYLASSMARDKDDYIFAVTEREGDIAMILMESGGQLHINEGARERLQALWRLPGVYERNMRRLIPAFARQLAAGEIPINGVKVVE